MSIPRRKSILKKTNGRCAYCGTKLGSRGWDRDHIRPLGRYRGVRYTFSGKRGCVHPERHVGPNIVAACRKCNKSKASMELEAWRALLGVSTVFYFEKIEG